MNAHYRFETNKTLLALIAVLAINVAGCASRQAYTRGNRAEITRDFDTAMIEYKAALDRDPRNYEIRLKYEQARYNSAFQHFEAGRRAFDKQDYETAKMEFTRVLEIDPTHTLAEQQLAKVNEVLTSRSRKEPEPEIQFEQLKEQTRSFWKPVNRTTILVSPDNQTKRRDYDELVLKTIYMMNSVTSTELTEAITTLRTLLNMRYLMSSTAMNAIIVRDAADRVAIAEKIIEDLDKAKPEVLVDAVILEVDRNLARQLGIVPPQGTAVSTFGGTGGTGASTGNVNPLNRIPR